VKTIFGLNIKRFLTYSLLVTCLFLLVNCANRGRPAGGPKDITPPEITRSSPENFSTNFNETEIKISFDEYVKIKNLQKNLIISPPMDPEPEISPIGSASKEITIKITDTLLANTTYAFNFGESIVDNNEENPYPFYRYIFSTGEYIDSLSVSGYVTDALERETDEFITVMLYDIDSSFTDSIIYKQKPKYITNTLDSTTTFTLENIKAGTYLMLALKDENGNYTYEPKSDKIGFISNPVTIPTDTIYGINLFKEVLDFKASRPQLISGQKIAFGYEGTHDEMKLRLLSDKPQAYAQKLTKDLEKDTIYFWYKPKIEADSLLFEVINEDYIDTLTVRLKDLESDSLILKAVQRNQLLFTEDFTLEPNIPIDAFDESKISLLDKDSLPVDFDIDYDSFNNKISFLFDKTENNTYRFEMLPEAFTDFFGAVNDTLNFNLNTREYSDFGNLRLNLQNATYPVVAQLVDQNGVVKFEQISTKDEPIDFRYLSPGVYYIRVIYDTNGNGKYDPGNYLEKRSPERVSYMSEPYEARSFYDEILTFTLED